MKSGDVDGPAIGMGMSTGCADVGAGAPPQLASTSAAKRPAHRGICARRYGEIVSGPCLELAAVSAYLLLKLAHVFLAIVAIGTNLSYSLWLRAGEREPAHLAYTIRGIRAIDRRLANPAYALLLVTGLLIILVTGIPLTQLWLLLAIAIYVAAAIIGYFVFGPVVRRELAALERGGVDDPEYRRCRDQARTLGIVTAAMVLFILALMVTKPS